MTRTLVISLSIAFALSACGGKKDNDNAKGGDTSADKAADKAAPPVAQPIESLFSGPKVQFPAVAQKLKLGMSEADAKAAAPEVFAAKYGYQIPGVKGAEVEVQVNDGLVYQIYLKLDEPIEKVSAWMEKKWGKPRVSKSSIGSPELYFDSPEVGLRAKLEKYGDTSTMLRYIPVMSKEQFLGADPKLWGFEKVPLIGMTSDDMLKAFAAYRPTPRKDDPESIVLNFPALTTTEYGSSVDVRVKGGTVTGYSMSINTGGDAATDAAVAARLEQLFGKGKDDRGMYIDYPGPPKAKAELRKDSASFGHTVWVGDHKK
jgi:hypothetical protein